MMQFDEVFNRQFSTDVRSSSLLHMTQFDEGSKYKVKIKLPLHFLQLPWLNVDANILTAPNLLNQVPTKCVSGREGGKGGRGESVLPIYYYKYILTIFVYIICIYVQENGIFRSLAIFVRWKNHRVELSQ